MPHDESTYYEILGVPCTASAEQIRHAYREKMKETHPDQFTAKLFEAHASGDESRINQVRREIARAEERAKRVNMAYATLSNPAKRRRYDIDMYARNRMRSGQSPPTRSRPTARQPSASSTQANDSWTRSTGSASRGSRAASSADYSGRASSLVNLSSGCWPGLIVVITMNIALMVLGALGDLSDSRQRNLSGTHQPSVVTATYQTGEAVQSTQAAVFNREAEAGQLVLNEAFSAFGQAEMYFERGMDHLAQSIEVRDADERLAVLNLLYATVLDPDYRIVYRALGEIYYNRWQDSQNADDRQLAQAHLKRYETLTDEPVDADVQSMLDALD